MPLTVTMGGVVPALVTAVAVAAGMPTRCTPSHSRLSAKSAVIALARSVVVNPGAVVANVWTSPSAKYTAPPPGTKVRVTLAALIRYVAPPGIAISSE